MKRVAALSIAQNLVEELIPVCERIQIAGSLRREKSEVKDIEIVAIPARGETHVIDMFGNVIESKKCSTLDTLLDFNLGQEAFAWEKDEEIKRWGPRYKRLRHRETGIRCDMFLTDKERWAYQLTIRTGPAGFSKAIVTLALRRGWHFTDSLLHLHTKDEGKPCPVGEKCSFVRQINTEAELFKVLGLPWPKVPAERTTEWLNLRHRMNL